VRLFIAFFPLYSAVMDVVVEFGHFEDNSWVAEEDLSRLGLRFSDENMRNDYKTFLKALLPRLASHAGKDISYCSLNPPKMYFREAEGTGSRRKDMFILKGESFHLIAKDKIVILCELLHAGPSNVQMVKMMNSDQSLLRSFLINTEIKLEMSLTLYIEEASIKILSEDHILKQGDKIYIGGSNIVPNAKQNLVLVCLRWHNNKYEIRDKKSLYSLFLKKMQKIDIFKKKKDDDDNSLTDYVTGSAEGNNMIPQVERSRGRRSAMSLEGGE
jgi:hypothetical protein